MLVMDSVYDLQFTRYHLCVIKYKDEDTNVRLHSEERGICGSLEQRRSMGLIMSIGY